MMIESETIAPFYFRYWGNHVDIIGSVHYPDFWRLALVQGGCLRMRLYRDTSATRSTRSLSPRFLTIHYPFLTIHHGGLGSGWRGSVSSLTSPGVR